MAKTERNASFFFYKYSFSKIKYLTITEKLDIEDDAKEQLMSEWGFEEELLGQIHIPCGKNIFNVENVLKEELLKRDNRIKLELKKKVEQGEKFIQKNGQTVIMA